MEELDLVTGGYSESDLTTEERFYIHQLMKSYVDACLAGKSEDEQRYQQLIFEFDEKMRNTTDNECKGTRERSRRL